MQEKIRSFIAFDIESAPILNEIAAFQTLLAKTKADLKIVQPKNIHITLRFLGNIAINMVETIFNEMKKTQFTPFNVNIRGVGAFPNLSYSRVVWAGITDGAIQLQSIFNQLEPRLCSLGFSPESRGFSPHLTIARVKSGRNKRELRKFITGNVNYEFGLFKAECLRLKRSQLTPMGPIYSTLKKYCP